MDPVRFRVQQLVGFVSAVDVRRLEPCLSQNTGREVAPLSHLTAGGDVPVTGKFAQAGPQVIHRDVHGSRDVPTLKSLRRPRVQQQGTFAIRRRQDRLQIDLGMVAPPQSARHEPRHVDRVLAEPYCGA